jgi:hypothetical protein
MENNFDYFSITEKHSLIKESVLLREDLQAYNKLIPALQKVENLFVQTFLQSSIGQSLGEQNLRAIMKPGFDIVAVGILLGGEESTRDALNSYQNELSKFSSTKLMPIVSKAKFGKGLQGIANKLKGRLNTSKGLMGKLKSLFNKTKDETNVRNANDTPPAPAPAPAPAPPPPSGESPSTATN